jgi:hypothetical protein
LIVESREDFVVNNPDLERLEARLAEFNIFEGAFPRFCGPREAPARIMETFPIA